jgi:hypothetical protein
VLSGLQDHDVVVGHEVHEAMGLVDASRPRTRQDVLERLGLSDAREGVSVMAP